MSKISIPEKRAYYPASEGEQDRLLCWIPVQEFESMVRDGRIPQDLADDYPGGVEVEVSTSAFAEFGVDLGITPENIAKTYKVLRTRGGLPKSGVVDGASLESTVQRIVRVGWDAAPGPMPTALGLRLSEPDWTDGDDAVTVMSNLE